MSSIVCHVEKLAAVDLRGAEIHNDRLSSNSSNKDIDYTRTERNFDALSGEGGNPHTNYRAEVEKRLKAKYKGSRAIRKDAVRLVSVVVSSDQQFFKDLGSETEVRRFFKTAAEHLGERFGRDNVVAAKVHMDETTPHMHFCFVPLTEDGRLSAKTIIDRKGLRSLQDSLPQALQKAGFSIQRGLENSPAKHLTEKAFKRQAAIKNAALEDIEQCVKQIDQSASIGRSGLFDGTQVAKLPAANYQVLRSIAEDYLSLRKQYEKLERTSGEKMSQKIKKLEATLEAVNKTCAELRSARSELNSKVLTYRKIKANVPKPVWEQAKKAAQIGRSRQKKEGLER